MVDTVTVTKKDAVSNEEARVLLRAAVIYCSYQTLEEDPTGADIIAGLLSAAAAKDSFRTIHHSDHCQFLISALGGNSIGPKEFPFNTEELIASIKVLEAGIL